MSSDGELAWRHAAEKVLKSASFDAVLRHRTADGMTLEPIYARRRGMTPVAGRPAGERWRIVQRVEHPDPATANALALAELAGGANGVTLVMADSPFARGFGLDETGLERALDGVHLEMATLRLEAGEAAPALATRLVELARHHGHAAPDIYFGFDPLGLLASQGRLGAGLANPLRSVGDLARHLGEEGHDGPAVVADSRVFHEAGATPVQELAIVLANAVAYLRALEAAGLPLRAARHWIEFVLAADSDVFMTLNRCRALRLLWAQVEAECGLEPAPFSLHVETSWRMLTKRDPWTNMLRAATAVFAAALGGADSIGVLPISSAHGLPDAFARRSARNAQHVLQEEANLYRIGDPAAGAGGFEALTDELCIKAWTLFGEIERRGGALECLVSGWLQKLIAGNPPVHAVLVGTTKFVATETDDVPVLDLAPKPWRFQGPAGLTAPALKRARLAKPHEAAP